MARTKTFVATIAALAAVALGGCAHAPARFEPTRSDQAEAGQPEAAAADVAGVRFVAMVGDWRGWPEDLDDYLTPVEIYVENHSGKAIRVRHENFGLVDASGFRYDALDPREVQRIVHRFGYPQTYVTFHYGWYGAYPWPWYPWPYRRAYYYPWVWWGYPWAYPWGVGVTTYVPAPSSSSPPAGPEGSLEEGGRVSVLVFFPVPASSLERLEVVADVVEQATGKSLGAARLSFVRSRGAPPPPVKPPKPPAPPAPPQPPAGPAPGSG